MSEKERKEFIKALRAKTRQLAGNKQASKAFLVRVGIITAKGNLRKPYRHLCIQQEQG